MGVPDVAVCGKNISEYIMNNDGIMKWLSVPNAANLSLMSIQPRIVSPQVMRIGLIQALNLELFAYAETYTDDDGTMKSYIGDDDFIKDFRTWPSAAWCCDTGRRGSSSRHILQAMFRNTWQMKMITQSHWQCYAVACWHRKR